LKNKSYISLLLSGLLCLHAWQMSLIVLNYEYNQEVFVRLFCENQDRPELQCNGQCFLKDSINQAAQQESPKGYEVKLSWPLLCMPEDAKADFNHLAYFFQVFFSFSDQEHPLLLPQGIFHPPRS
jgi:hypothetical protein